jgi:hypothetical protein
LLVFALDTDVQTFCCVVLNHFRWLLLVSLVADMRGILVALALSVAFSAWCGGVQAQFATRPQTQVQDVLSRAYQQLPHALKQQTLQSNPKPVPLQDIPSLLQAFISGTFECYGVPGTSPANASAHRYKWCMPDCSAQA